jgi:cytochrome oxidase Cu insertion factor (SCO1/SenC/PrrC family)
MENHMADTPNAPAANTEEGSILEAQNALLGLLESEDQPKAEEAPPTEVDESTDDPDESVEAVSEDEPVEEDSEEAESEDEEPEDDEELLFAVRVDGEEQEVTLDELLKGYSRQSAFTKKTQDLAEERKQIEALQTQYNQDMQQIQAERQQYAQHLQQIIENSGLDQYANVDWERLKTEDPIAFLEKKEEFREAQEKIVRVQQHQQQATARNQAEAQQQWQESVNQEHVALVEKLPEWGDPDKQKVLAGELRSYASSQGFQDAEIESLIDHRSFIILNKARLYDELQKSDPKTKKIRNKPRVIRSGKGAGKSEKTTKRTAMRNRLKESGHVNDAAALLENLIS